MSTDKAFKRDTQYAFKCERLVARALARRNYLVERLPGDIKAMDLVAVKDLKIAYIEVKAEKRDNQKIWLEFTNYEGLASGIYNSEKAGATHHAHCSGDHVYIFKLSDVIDYVERNYEKIEKTKYHNSGLLVELKKICTEIPHGKIKLEKNVSLIAKEAA